MGLHVLAISISKQIEQIGSIAGLAAILGLAVLSLLYFAQSREVKRLREWAGRAPERDAELQARVAEDAASRATGGLGTPAPAARPATAAARAAVPKPASAPATAAGQTAIVKPATPSPAAPAGAPPAAGAKPGTPAAPVPVPAAGAPPAAGAKPAIAPAPGVKPAAPAPTPPPSGPGAKPPVPPAPPIFASKDAPAAPVVRPRRTVTVGSTPSSATVAPRRDEPKERERLFSGRAIAFTAIAAALVVAVLLVSGIVGGGDDKEPTAATTTTSTTATQGGGAAPAEPADTPVAVLNGTTVTGLARQAADQLEARGYPITTTRDAADQAQQTSHVAFEEGSEEAAKRVARIVGISAGEVVPLDPSTRAIAGDSVSVVVTMGLDKAQ